MFMLSLMQPSGLYELEKDSLEAISAQLLQMIRMKSYELYTHSINVANYSVSIAAKLGLPANEIEQIRHGALLHDLGLIMMPSTVLKKAPFFNRQELSKYRQHPANGANMI
ncbi:HD-GYP domain-containing protein, partial [Veillonella seminalis]